MAKTLIVVKLQVQGLHQWNDAKNKLPQVAYLSFPHLHKFHVTVEKQTTSDDDRNIEIIMFEKELQDYFKRNYFDTQFECCNFHNRSCETIALDLLQAYDLDSCEVLEDNYWGAKVIK